MNVKLEKSYNTNKNIFYTKKPSLERWLIVINIIYKLYSLYDKVTFLSFL